VEPDARLVLREHAEVWAAVIDVEIVVGEFDSDLRPQIPSLQKGRQIRLAILVPRRQPPLVETAEGEPACAARVELLIRRDLCPAEPEWRRVVAGIAKVAELKLRRVLAVEQKVPRNRGRCIVSLPRSVPSRIVLSSERVDSTPHGAVRGQELVCVVALDIDLMPLRCEQVLLGRLDVCGTGAAD
jgi:hypothetical protein